MAGGLNLDDLAKDPRFGAVIAEEAKTSRLMRLVPLSGATFIITVVTLACLAIVGFGAEAKSVENAWSLLQTIVGGAIGFWAGQRQDRG